MPSMLDHESNRLVKALVAADSGSGKTGALACLVDAGFTICALDFDNGLSPIKNFVKDQSKLANFRYATLTDELGLTGGRFVIKRASAFQRAMDLLDKGGGEWGDDIPPITQMDSSYVLVFDSLSRMARACMLMVMAINGAVAKNPEIQHYGQAMDNIIKLLEQTTSARVPCHVIFNTHITKEEGSPKLYPETIGSKNNSKIASHFDNFFSLSVNPATGKRTFKTKRDGLLALKSAKPLADEYDISDGWTRIFKELTGVKDIAELLTPAKEPVV